MAANLVSKKEEKMKALETASPLIFYILTGFFFLGGINTRDVSP